MSIEEAVKILKEHNQWRLGNDKYQMADPKDLTMAIKTVCDYVEKIEWMASLWKFSLW